MLILFQPCFGLKIINITCYMIRKCNNNQLAEILGYIGEEDYPQCLYLYLDLIKYGCSSETTQTWIQYENESITAVVLAYHTALHIFSRNNVFDAREVRDLVKETNPTIINARANTIKLLEPLLTDLGFISEFGHIGEWSGIVDNEDNNDVVKAEEKDIPEIATLLYEDEDIGASYVFDDLLKQMKERLEQGYVRSYVIRRDGKTVAHVGTGAEMNGVCTIAYTIISPMYRGQGMAGKLYRYACGHLKREGKRIFSIYYPDNARRFHNKVGFVDICECGKLFKTVE